MKRPIARFAEPVAETRQALCEHYGDPGGADWALQDAEQKLRLLLGQMTDLLEWAVKSTDDEEAARFLVALRAAIGR